MFPYLATFRSAGALKMLDVSFNGLGDEGEKALREAVTGRDGFELKM